MDEPRIRAAVRTDIAALLKVERSAPTAAHWSEQQYEDVFSAIEGSTPRLVLVAESDSAPPVGFLVARHIAPDWELENVVVEPAARRQGLGKRLLQALLFHAAETHNTEVFLEVRESNQAARALYESAGFQQVGRRKSYYANPLEDAIIYRLDLR